MAKIINIATTDNETFGLDNDGKLWSLTFSAQKRCRYWNLVVDALADGGDEPTKELLNEEV